MKKFMKKTEGFTLVELIVVIAILGILAGVGTVGYSGYIKKANQAADNQLVAALNYAYAAACLESGVDATTTTAADITVGSDKKVGEADIAVSNPAEKADAIKAAFAKYYAGNENAEFKVATKLTFANGMFAADFAEGGTVAAWVEAFKSSTFGSMDVSDVVDTVDNVNSVFKTMIADENYLGTLKVMDTGFASYLSTEGIDETNPQAVANAAIMYVAANSAGMDVESIYNQMLQTYTTEANKGSAADFTKVMEPLFNNDETILSNAALSYGIITGFVNSGMASQSFMDLYNSSDFSAGLNDDLDGDTDSLVSMANALMGEAKIAEYFTTKGLADMQGYTGALSAFNENAGLVDGKLDQEGLFSSSNSELMDAISAILGNN